MTDHSLEPEPVNVNLIYQEILTIHRRIALILEQNNAILSFLFAQQRNDAPAEESPDMYFSDFLSS